MHLLFFKRKDLHLLYYYQEIVCLIGLHNQTSQTSAKNQFRDAHNLQKVIKYIARRCSILL